MYCCLFATKSTAEGQMLAKGEHNILSPAKCGREKLHP